MSTTQLLAFAASHGQTPERLPFISADGAVMVDEGFSEVSYVPCRTLREVKEVLNY